MINQNNKKILVENILKRKGMFIPVLYMLTFWLVGYIAKDEESPRIISDTIEVLYGMPLEKSMFDIIDNKDSFESLQIDIDDQAFDCYQTGIYDIQVSATDVFSNTSTKTIKVEVVDRIPPQFHVIKAYQGYTLMIPLNGSENIEDYIQAIDDVDGDVSTFIELSEDIDTTQIHRQTIEATVSDNFGNQTSEKFEFAVCDFESPTIEYLQGQKIILDYGSQFVYSNYIKVYDNYDQNISLDDLQYPINTTNIETIYINEILEDSSYNKISLFLEIEIKDLSPPNIILKDDFIEIETNQKFDARKYLDVAFDNKDGDVTKDVIIENHVDTTLSGQYKVLYTATDQFENQSQKYLTVNVVDTKSYIVESAMGRLGFQYVYGKSGPTAFDCSGFTQWVYKQNEITLSRTASSQYSETQRIVKNRLKRGDLVFFRGTTGGQEISHVGIYIGKGQFIHAANSKSGVKISSLDSTYWKKHWAGGGKK